VPLMKIGCCLILLFVKSICTDLDSLSFIRHFLHKPISNQVPYSLSREGYLRNMPFETRHSIIGSYLILEA
jgi:hypothetical protein